MKRAGEERETRVCPREPGSSERTGGREVPEITGLAVFKGAPKHTQEDRDDPETEKRARLSAESPDCVHVTAPPKTGPQAPPCSFPRMPPGFQVFCLPAKVARMLLLRPGPSLSSPRAQAPKVLQ